MKALRMLAACLAGAALLALGEASSPSSGDGGDRAFPIATRSATSGERAPKDRAFLYAPPPITHSLMKGNSNEACLECHALETDISKRHHALAPMPHPFYSQCLQCHVKADAKVPPMVASDFVGLDLPGKGSRAYPQAPPTVPHRLFMRDNCHACHGPAGDRALRTPHPERSQCLQCHVPEAAADYTRPTPAWGSLTPWTPAPGGS